MTKYSGLLTLAIVFLVSGSLLAQEPRSSGQPPAGVAPAARAGQGDSTRPGTGRSGVVRGPGDGRRQAPSPDLPIDDRPGRRPMPPDRRGGQRVQPPGAGIGPSPLEMQRLAQDDPEMHALIVEDNRLDRECLALARQVREAKSSDREKLQTELAVVVNKHFEVRQKRRELSLARMEEELKRLREAIESRNESREEIVLKRLAELVGENRDLDF